MTGFLYATTLGFLFTHELDAVTHREWRLLYVLRRLSEPQGRRWFVAVHVPLFAALIWLPTALPAGQAEWVMAAVAAFCLVHAGLHVRLRSRPESGFTGALSWGLIGGAAIAGLATLLSVAA